MRNRPSIDAIASSKNEELKRLHENIITRDITVGVVGLGYVGLPLIKNALEKGFKVIGFDKDEQKVKSLNENVSYIHHIPHEVIAGMNATERFSASSELHKISDVDAIIICVPTPLNRNREPDMEYVVSAAESLVPYLRKMQLVTLESTTYPGTTHELVRPILEKSGLVCDKDCFLAYSPEREDPGNERFTMAEIPKVVGAEGPNALFLARALYSQMVTKTIDVSSSATAEAVKLTENIFRSVNIALVNELKIIYDTMGNDIWEVIEAAKTKPFGFMPFYPGPGIGGHCIPSDPFYLAWKAREYDIATHFIELAGEINTSMPRHIIDRTARVIDRKFKRGLNGSKILVLGVAYKKNVDDIRDSPSLRLIELAEERGAHVEFYDPFVSVIRTHGHHPTLNGRRSIEWALTRLAEFDAVLIATDHDCVDYHSVVEHSRCVIDTRNATKAVRTGRDKIVMA